MQRLVGRALILSALLVASCSSGDEEASTLMHEAQEFVRQASAHEHSHESSPADFEKALELYTEAAVRVQRIKNEFPTTLVGQGVVNGNADVGGMSVESLLLDKIPKTDQMVHAQHDPAYTAWLLAEQIQGLEDRAAILVAVTKLLAHSHSKEDARRARTAAVQAIQSLPAPEARIELLCALASDEIGAGDKASALELAFTALSAAKRTQDPKERSKELARVALTYYTLGVEQRAFEALQSISSKEARTEIIRTVAAQLVEQNMPAQARAATEALVEPAARAGVLLDLAELVAQRPESHDADTFLDAAKNIVSGLAPTEEKIALLTRTAGLLNREEQRFSAQELLLTASQSISGTGLNTILALSELAKRYAALGDVTSSTSAADRAFELGRKIPEGPDRDFALVAVVTAAAASQQYPKTNQLAATIKTPLLRAQAYFAAAEQAMGGKNQPMAQAELLKSREAIALIPTLEDRTPLRIKVRDLYLLLGDVEQAQKVAFELKGEDKKWRSYLKGFHGAMLKNKQFEQALALARSIDEPFLKAILLAETAKARATPESMSEAVSLLDEAVQVADKAENPARKAAMSAYFADIMLQIHWPKLAEDVISNSEVSDKAIWFCKIADSYGSQGQKQEARDSLRKALDEAKTFENPLDKAKVLIEVARVRQALELQFDAELMAGLKSLLPN